MNYDIGGTFIGRMKRQQIPLRQITSLQEKILKNVCTVKDASYLSIMRHTRRSRVTILQSLESLVKHSFVEKKKIYPAHRKSKLTFRPTQKGILYSLAFLDTDYDDVLNAYADAAQMSEYNQRVRSVPDYDLRKKLMSHFSRFVLEEDYFTEDGRLKSLASEDFLNLGLRIGLLQSSRDKNFDFKNLFDPKAISFIKDIYTEEEKRVIKEVLIKIRQNLDSSINQLPD